MLATTENIATIVERWLAEFGRALAEADTALLESLFHPDSYWRDVLALTWHIRTTNGRDAIVHELKAHAGGVKPTGFKTDPNRTAPRHVTRAGTKAIEAIFKFETAEGRGSGVLRRAAAGLPQVCDALDHEREERGDARQAPPDRRAR